MLDVDLAEESGGVVALGAVKKGSDIGVIFGEGRDGPCRVIGFNIGGVGNSFEVGSIDGELGPSDDSVVVLAVVRALVAKFHIKKVKHITR